MLDETGSEPTRSDAPSADESLFGEEADSAPAEVADEKEVGKETTQDPEDSDDAEGETSASETETPEDLKVVVSIKGGRATIGVQRTSSDPYIESFDDPDLSGLTREALAVVERARDRWEEAPKHPAYVRPTPPSRRRNQRGHGAVQGATATQAAAQAQQQALRLF